MNYVTSKDYEKLWELVQEGKEVVCFISTGTWNEVPRLVTQEVCIGRTKAVFIDEVRKLNLQFLPPNEWIKIESDKDLPPKGDYCVLVYRPKDNDYEVVHVNYFYSPYAAPKKFYQVTGVTHWKPMPEAPEVEA